MDFHIGSAILDRDGKRLGTLTHVIVDPRTKQVVEIVLAEGGLIGRDLIVPAGAVNTADAESVKVELDHDQLDKLQSFAVTHYSTPSFDAGDYPAGALIAPGMAPVGAAAGLETIGMMPIVEVTEQIPEGDIDIEPGTEVWANDGKIGTIRDVMVDEQTRRVTSFVIEKGFWFHSDLEIMLDQVATIGAERVTLKVAKADLRHTTRN